MKKLTLILLLIFATLLSNAQFFSGNYHSEPAMNEFDHLKIHHHHSPHHKYEGDLTVVAYGQKSELWKMKANMITGEKADYFILNFGDSLEIRTVYEFKIALDGIEEDYILMGYENKEGHGRFLAIEVIFSDETEEKMLDLKSFRLIKKH
jgi:hypothetical protein